MKRTIAFILALVMTLALVACGGDKPTSTPAISDPTKPATSDSAKPATSDPAKPAEPEKPAEDPDAWKYGGDLIIGVGDTTWTCFDPAQRATAGDKYTILHYTEGMALKDINGKIYPQVCDVEESPDGKTIRFTLRERYFSNGEKITIEDVDASIRRAAAVVTETNFKKVWEGTTYKVDGNSILITMDTFKINCLAGLVSDGTYYKIMPKEVCDKYPISGGTMQPCGLVMGGTAPKIDNVADAIGSGPYKIDSWSEFEVKLSRNEYYESLPNEDAIGVAKEAKCYMDTLTFQLNKDESSITAATLVGDYHIGMVSAEMRETAKTMGVKIGPVGTTWTHGIFFNLHETNTDSPVYNVNVRKAIRACLDVDAIMLAIVGGDKSTIDYPLTPTPVVKESVYHNTMLVDSGEWNIKDVNKAKEYLKAAGYDGTPIKYLTHASGLFYKAAMAIIPMMESAGMNVELMVVDNGSHAAMRNDPAKTGYDIGCWEVQKNTENPVLHATYVTGTQGWWSSPARDAAIATMMASPSGSDASIKAYEDYTQAVIDECPYILFGNDTGTVAYRDNLEWATVGQVNYYYWNFYFTDNQK